jgi:hypothetical protein
MSAIRLPKSQVADVVFGSILSKKSFRTVRPKF